MSPGDTAPRTTPGRRRLIAAGALIAVAGAAAVTALGATASADETSLTIVDGDLDWGLKASFRNYVTGPIGHGRITLDEGTEQNADGTYRFTGGTGLYDLVNHDITVAYDGGVHFQAHPSGDEWLLDLHITDIRVVTDGASSTGSIIADLTSKDASTGEFTTYDDSFLADLDLAGIAPVTGADGYVTVADIPAKLNIDGARAFGGFYIAGTALDPVTFSVLGQPDDPDPSDPSSSDPSDPSDPESPPDPDPSDPAGPPAAADGAIVDGTLDWGVKESFRSYIVGPIAHGGVELSEGAIPSGDVYRYVEATGTYDAAAGTTTAAFAGAVRFYGHEQADGSYALDLTFTDLSVELTGSTGVLYTGDTPLADLEGAVAVDGDVVSLSDAPATLTAEGADFFGGYYQEGTELDPVSFALALDEDADLPGTGEPTDGGNGGGDGAGGGPSVSLPVTGFALTGIVGGGLALVLAGAGAVWLAARRRREGVPV